VRAFDDEDVIHVDGGVNPSSDIETINTELILADLQTVDARLPKLEKEAKRSPELADQLAATKIAHGILNEGRTISSAAANGEVDLEALHDLHLLTAKPFLYVFNVDEGQLSDTDLHARLRSLVAPAEAVVLCAQLEAELAQLDAADAADLLASYGQDEPGLNQLIRQGFSTLGLQTYLTAGPMEARAWTIKVGATAPEAAGVIHTDFQRGFIKAEVVAFQDLVDAGSMTSAKAAGKVRMEGKDYVMADGDVVEFRFNV
jgi:hypothetical protein